jgi:hypothetical protein
LGLSTSRWQTSSHQKRESAIFVVSTSKARRTPSSAMVNAVNGSWRWPRRAAAVCAVVIASRPRSATGDKLEGYVLSAPSGRGVTSGSLGAVLAELSGAASSSALAMAKSCVLSPATTSVSPADFMSVSGIRKVSPSSQTPGPPGSVSDLRPERSTDTAQPEAAWASICTYSGERP